MRIQQTSNISNVVDSFTCCGPGHRAPLPSTRATATARRPVGPLFQHHPHRGTRAMPRRWQRHRARVPWPRAQLLLDVPGAVLLDRLRPSGPSAASRPTRVRRRRRPSPAASPQGPRPPPAVTHRSSGTGVVVDAVVRGRPWEPSSTQPAVGSLTPQAWGSKARPRRPWGSRPHRPWELDPAWEELRGLESAAAAESVTAAADLAVVTADSAAAANVGARGDVGEELTARAEGRRARRMPNGAGYVFFLPGDRKCIVG